MRQIQGRRTNDQAGIRAVELRPELNTIEVCLVENIKGHLDVLKKFKYALYLRQD